MFVLTIAIFISFLFEIHIWNLINYYRFVIIDRNGECDILPFVTSGSFQIRTVNQKLLKFHVYIKTLNAKYHIKHFFILGVSFSFTQPLVNCHIKSKHTSQKRIKITVEGKERYNYYKPSYTTIIHSWIGYSFQSKD